MISSKSVLVIPIIRTGVKNIYYVNERKRSARSKITFLFCWKLQLWQKC